MKAVGLVAALPGELAPLVRGWARSGAVHLGTLSPEDGQAIRIYAAAAGMGGPAAARAFALVRAAAEAQGRTLDAVVSYGWAGAISCGVKPPEVHVAAEVIESRTGERFLAGSQSPRQGARLRLVTIDHIARPGEKRALAERHQAVLVDMEAATVARLARAHGLEFHCVKGISDGYTDALPDFNRFLDAKTRLQLRRFILHALAHPAQWHALVKLGRQSKAAAEALARELPGCLAGTRLIS